MLEDDLAQHLPGTCTAHATPSEPLEPAVNEIKLSELPDDVILACSAYLSTTDLFSLLGTSQRLRHVLLSNPEPWEAACGMWQYQSLRLGSF